MKLSIAGWSLWRHFKGQDAPALSLVDFAAFSKEHFGVDAVELNSPFFTSTDPAYLQQLCSAAQKAGVALLNIAVDEQGDLSSADESARQLGLSSYGKWIDIAKHCNISAVRFNSGGKDAMGKTDAEKAQYEIRCISSFTQLGQRALKAGVKVMMENHWGISADAAAMVRIIKAVRANIGPDGLYALPDYGNWPTPSSIDRYESLKMIMPYALAVHAKVKDILPDGTHPEFDLAKCLAITKASGYQGHLGIEYEGSPPQLQNTKRACDLMRKLA